jgi:hypothetical protein
MNSREGKLLHDWKHNRRRFSHGVSNGTLLGAGLVILAWLAFWGGVIWIACHFIAKFW